MQNLKILDIKGYEILASNGQPTLECSIKLSDGKIIQSAISYGASAGTYESFMLIDNDKSRFNGKGMLKSAHNINEIIKPHLIGMEIGTYEDIAKIDSIMIALDGTKNKSNLGGNTILAVSISITRAIAYVQGIEVYELLKTYDKLVIPSPNMVVIEGGKHADNSTDIQEYALCYKNPEAPIMERIQKIEDIYIEVKKELKKLGYNTNVGSEGAFAPSGIISNTLPIEIIENSISKLGLSNEVGIYLDIAANEMIMNGKYRLNLEDKNFTNIELLDWYKEFFISRPSISFIEDGFSENDWDAWNLITKLRSDKYIVMDDLTVSNMDILQKAIDNKIGTHILIKPNQIGSVSEVLATCKLANDNGIKCIVSHRGGGEAVDTFISDLAIAVSASHIKCGPTRGERVEKYNRFIRIENNFAL